MARKFGWMVTAMPETRPVRFGVVGCGSASIPVCEAIATVPQAILAAVYDLNPDLAHDLSQRFQVPRTETLDDLVNDPAVDAVYIAVPHYRLAPLTRQALEAGKHALTEKPLAISLEEIDMLIQLADERQLTLGVFYEMRYAPAHAPARELVRAGAIGDIIGIQIQNLIDKPLDYWQAGYSGRSINPWRGIQVQAGGGVVLMNTSHLLDAVSYVTGLAVTTVCAQIGTLVAGVEVEDTASAILRFDNGAVGSLMAGAHISGAHDEERFQIYGTQGQLRLPDPYGSSPLQLCLKRDWNSFSAGKWHSLPMQPVPVYERAIEDFVQAVQSRQPVPVDAQAARKVLAVVLAIYQSAAEERIISVC
jgi:predicted dehydrogenase